MRGEQVFAGISCKGVLEKLSAFVDDELDAGERDQIIAHLESCSACTRFGDEFSRIVQAVKNSHEINDEAMVRLLDRLCNI